MPRENILLGKKQRLTEVTKLPMIVQTKNCLVLILGAVNERSWQKNEYYLTETLAFNLATICRINILVRTKHCLVLILGATNQLSRRKSTVILQKTLHFNLAAICRINKWMNKSTQSKEINMILKENLHLNLAAICRTDQELFGLDCSCSKWTQLTEKRILFSRKALPFNL